MWISWFEWSVVSTYCKPEYAYKSLINLSTTDFRSYVLQVLPNHHDETLDYHDDKNNTQIANNHNYRYQYLYEPLEGIYCTFE